MKNIICFVLFAVCTVGMLHFLTQKTSPKKPWPTDPNDPALIIRKLPNGGVERYMTEAEEKEALKPLTIEEFRKAQEDLRKRMNK